MANRNNRKKEKIPVRKSGVKKIEALESQKQSAVQKEILANRKSTQMAVWVIGILLSLLPLLLAKGTEFVYNEKEEIRNNCKTYFWSFIDDGSFLWISITLLSTSLVELIMKGFHNEKHLELLKRIFVVFGILMIIIATFFFWSNIGSRISNVKMRWISGVVFILFSVCSGIVAFKLVKRE